MENDKVAKEKKPSKSRKRGQGEGSIFQRSDGRWCAAMVVGYRDGRPRRKHFYGETRSDVADRLTRALQELQQGIIPADDRIKLDAFLDHWLEDTVKPSVRPKTYDSYKQLARLYLKPDLGHVRLSKLTPHDVRKFMNAKIETGLSARTVLYCRAVLRRALRQAVCDGIIFRNVATLVEPPRSVRSEVKVLTPEQAGAFLEAIKEDRLQALYTVALSLGLRQGEALGLRWQDLDFDNRTLRVNKALQRVNGKVQLVEPKTNRSRRTLPLPDSAVQSLCSHRVRQMEERLKAGERWHEAGFVFTTPIGTPLDPRNVLREYHAALKRAGLPRFRFHDLRHSCASLLLAQGVQPRTVMEILGHSQISITMDTYAHVMPAMMRDAADAMDSALSARK